MTTFERMRREAVVNGWTVPGKHTAFSDEVWMRYWQQCRDYESNPEKGRPVAPHRSA